MKKAIFILLLFKLTDAACQNSVSFLLKPSISFEHYWQGPQSIYSKYYPNPNMVWGISYTHQFEKIKHSIEVELLYFNKTSMHFFSISNIKYKEYRMTKKNQIIMPINFQFKLNKSNISIGIVPTFIFGGYNYYSEYKAKNDNSYFYASERFETGVQLKYGHRILENEKSLLFIEPYLLSYDFIPKRNLRIGYTNMGIGLKWLIKK